MSKFLLILGPSGVGKSSIIEELILLDNRFVYISPFITRPLREGEINKIFLDKKEMDVMSKQGKFLAINELYNIYYATPRLPIEEALKNNLFPILDWPISKIEIMTQAFPHRLFIVYISPPSIKVLQQRLKKDSRDKDGCRLKSAQEELIAYKSHQDLGILNLQIISEENQIPKVAHEIYINYLQSFS